MIGAGLYLGTYVALQYRRDFAKTFAYSFYNFLAAVFVLISLSHSWNLSAAIIQAMWILISLFGMYKCKVHSARPNFRYISPKRGKKLRNILKRCEVR